MASLQFLSDISFLKDILVPSVAAIFAVWIATRKFRREQLWKEKYAAYQSVLRSLESIAYWASETESKIHRLPTTDTKDIEEEYSLARREVIRQDTIGRLLLSNDFYFQLIKFRGEFDMERLSASKEQYDDPRDANIAWAEHASKLYGIVSRHVFLLTRLARKDLGA